MVTTGDLGKHIGGFFTVEEIRALSEEGKNTFRITGGGAKEVGERREERAYLSFADTAKELILNATRHKQLTALFGADADLTGKQIRLDVERIRGTEQIIILGVE